YHLDLLSTRSLRAPTPPTEIYTLSLHDALPISAEAQIVIPRETGGVVQRPTAGTKTRLAVMQYESRMSAPVLWEVGQIDTSRCRSEEHTSELQSRENLVCRLLLEKKKPPRVRSR